MENSAPWLPYLMLVLAAALQDAFAPALVKSEVKVLEFKPTSFGQVFSVGLQSVEVCAKASGIDVAMAYAVNEADEKRILPKL